MNIFDFLPDVETPVPEKDAQQVGDMTDTSFGFLPQLEGK